MLARFEKVIPRLFLSLFFILFFFHLNSLENQQRYTPQRYNLFYSDEKQFVWVRVFKAASSTTKAVLIKNTPDLIQIRRHKFPNKFKNYFKFSFVRNSWDRVVSCYFNKIVTKKARDFEECFDKDFDFFVDYINKLDVTQANSHLKLQTRLIPVDQLDFIGRVDNFTNDIKYVCDVIGITCDTIPHRLKTEHAHYSTYYTSRTRRIIAKKYKEEIEAFGFTFETK